MQKAVDVLVENLRYSAAYIKAQFDLAKERVNGTHKKTTGLIDVAMITEQRTGNIRDTVEIIQKLSGRSYSFLQPD